MSSALISKKDFSKALKLEKLNLGLLAPALMKLLKIEKINKIYEDNDQFTGTAFIEKILEELGIQYGFDEADLNHIPKTGPLSL